MQFFADNEVHLTRCISRPMLCFVWCVGHVVLAPILIQVYLRESSHNFEECFFLALHQRNLEVICANKGAFLVWSSAFRRCICRLM